MPDEISRTIRLEPPADETTVTAAPGRAQSQLTARPGDRFGRYKILEEIGQGGCGAVFVAEQEEPVRRRVALKVIKLGMDTRQVVARFEAERQALAMMDHPNIARVLDAGATDTGRPFFVMELVRGIKITDYCDQNKLSTSERLRLFIQVCQAVQHAHQKGIIHRDLKPSNILVALQDGVPVPKVIDFGIAKATADQKLTDKTVYTAFEQFIGTPAYMSPEQAEMSALDIDTRSDIYSLGVLLYELLTGETPFTSEELLGVGLEAMRHILREKDPARPSTKLSTMTHADLTAIALHRQSEPPQLIKSVRGDLDWIVMKCLEKDRTRRYETANGLAMDIERHLANEPVMARPPSNVYRLRKMVGRNKLAFAAAGAVAFALMAGLVVSIWMYLGERQARQAADRAEQEQNRARAQAATEAARSQQVARFLEDMLNGVGPSVAQGSDTKLLREILDKTAERVGRDLTNQPSVEAELETTIGKAYYAIGEDQKAQANLENAVALRRKLAGGNSVELADSLNALAMVRWRQSSLDAAENLAREALAMDKSILGSNNPAVADCLDTLGTVLNSKDNRTDSEAVLREALAIRSKQGENLAFAETLGNLSAVLQRRGAKDESEAMARKSVAVKKKLLGVDPSVATALNSLGYTLLKEGKLEEAEGLLREALAMRRKLFAKDHPDLALSLINLADTLAGEGKLEEAEGMALESLAMRRRLGLTNDVESCGFLNHTAATLRLRNKFTEAEDLLREALALEGKVTKKPGRNEEYTLTQLGSVLRDQGRFSEAEAVFQQDMSVQKQSWGYTEPDRLNSLAAACAEAGQITNAVRVEKEATALAANEAERKDFGENLSLYEAHLLGPILLQEKRYAEFEALYKKESKITSVSTLNWWAWDLATSYRPEVRDGAAAVYLAEAAVMKTDRKDPQKLDTLAAAYAEAGQFTNAVRVEKEAIALAPNEADRSYFRVLLKLFEANTPYRDDGQLAEKGKALLENGQFAEAGTVLRECLDIREEQMPDDWHTFNSRSMLGGALLGQKRFAEAEPLLLSGYEGLIQRRSSIPVILDAERTRELRLREALQRLIQLYEQTARPDRAAEYKKQLAELDKPQM